MEKESHPLGYSNGKSTNSYETQASENNDPSSRLAGINSIQAQSSFHLKYLHNNTQQSSISSFQQRNINDNFSSSEDYNKESNHIHINVKDDRQLYQKNNKISFFDRIILVNKIQQVTQKYQTNQTKQIENSKGEYSFSYKNPFSYSDKDDKDVKEGENYIFGDLEEQNLEYKESKMSEQLNKEDYFSELMSMEISDQAEKAIIIGSGSRCQIYSMTLPALGSMRVVLKANFHRKSDQYSCTSHCQSLSKEFFILQKFEGHPNIIQAYSIENDIPLLQKGYKNSQPKNCCLVMEEATCDLMTYFQSGLYEFLPYQNSLQQFNNSFHNSFSGVFFDICMGLEEVHSSCLLAHNDLKPENMLFFSSNSSLNKQSINQSIYDQEQEKNIQNGRAKLCDFEYCSQRYDLRRTDFTYQSPEIVEIYNSYRDSNFIDTRLFEINLFKNDIFSLGTTMFSSVFGFYPFSESLGKDSSDLLYSRLLSDSDSFWNEKDIQSACQNILDTTSTSYLYNLQSLMEDTLSQEPTQRSDISSLLNHDFFEHHRSNFQQKKSYPIHQNDIIDLQKLYIPNQSQNNSNTYTSLSDNSEFSSGQISQESCLSTLIDLTFHPKISPFLRPNDPFSHNGAKQSDSFSNQFVDEHSYKKTLNIYHQQLFTGSLEEERTNTEPTTFYYQLQNQNNIYV